MDYFYASDFKNGYAPGLFDKRLGVRFRASDKVDMDLNYHHFSTAAKLPESERSIRFAKSITRLLVGDEKNNLCRIFLHARNGNHDVVERRVITKSWKDWGMGFSKYQSERVLFGEAGKDR